MAVGITILSGVRRGEELGLDQPEFRAGDDPACELFFDPAREPGAAGREALFRLGDDGWYVKNVRGAALSVNRRPIETTTRLRSGDVVRFSPDGPEFAFKLLARLPAGRASASADAKVPLRETGAVPMARFRDWRMLAALVAGTAVGLLVLFLVLRQPARSVDARKVPTAEMPDEARPMGASSDEAGAVARSGDLATTKSGDLATAKSVDRTTTKSGDTAATEVARSGDLATTALPPKDSPDDAVLLVLVEEPKSASAWPFGSAAAIADRTLLTSATVATGLAGFREKGWRLWAANQRLGLKVEINDLRIHAAFASAQGQVEKQIYVDLGLLTVGGPLPKQLRLANADELADLDRGMAVTLLGYLYENEPVDRFQTFLPEPHAGKIFVITSLPPSPGGPRLLHVRAELLGKMYGAAVLNQAGHLVGIFAETALPSPDGQSADLQIHYVPVIDPQQIDRWIEDRDEQWWAPATPSPTSK